jgi:GGDEF domain-containing protein
MLAKKFDCSQPDRRDGETCGELPVVTVSAGVASSPEAGVALTVDQLWARADDRLYRAKERRNCVVATDAPQRVPHLVDAAT